VVWRAAIAQASASKYTIREQDAETLRRYLLGETSFPETGACLLVLHDLPVAEDACLAATFTPVTTQNPGHDNHRFTIFGLQYIIATGDPLPVEARRRRIVRGEDNMVFLAPQGYLAQWLGPQIFGVKPFGERAR
jgi:hypothetical protein